MSGWIKLHRKILNSPIFDNPNLLKMWLWCLLKASHKGYKQIVGLEEIELKEGQFITGRNKGSSELNVNPNTFYKHLKTLEKTQMIELESNNKMTVVTIVNWGLYQETNNDNNNQITTEEQPNNNRITTEEQPNNTNKNVKKDKNVKNDKEDIYILDENEKQFLDILNKINNYPLDRNKDLEMYKSLEERYPNLNLLEAIEQWRMYKLDQPLKVKSNPRSQINSAFKKYVEWGKCLKRGGVASGQHRANNGGASTETLRLERIAKEQGLIGPDGSVEEPGEVDF